MRKEIMNVTLPPDPWQKVMTSHDLPADEVISALQKEIRRGNTENACRLAYELISTSPELEEKLWIRLLVIAVEDVGFGEVNAPVLIHSLYGMHQQFSIGALDRPLFAIHAVRYLCNCEKDRSSDEMLNWLKQTEEAPEIPDYAVDMHTKRGQEMGRDIAHFFNEASKVAPEKPDRNTTYRERLLRLLDENNG
jgi:replication-associated recombination protein RarA